MRRFLFKDSIRYLPYNYQSEQELENFVVEHHEEIFGENTLFFEKKKLRTPSGIGSIPDGFVLDLKKKKWYIVEVELAAHSVFNHITSQLFKFSVSISKRSTSREKLHESFFEAIKDDPKMRFKMTMAGITKELHKFVFDVVKMEPEIIIIIDTRTHEVEEACDILPFKTGILEFNTFVREGYGIGDHIHVLESLRGDVRILTPPKKEEQKHKDDSQAGIIKTVKLTKDYSGKKPVAFTFQGKRYEVKFWRRILFKICEILAERHPKDFHKVLDLEGKKKRPFFVKNKGLVKYPFKIKGTDIFTPCKLSANEAIRRSKTVIALFGYSLDDLTIETR